MRELLPDAHYSRFVISVALCIAAGVALREAYAALSPSSIEGWSPPDCVTLAMAMFALYRTFAK